MNHAKKTKNGNWVIPNSFQTPNLFIDKLMYYLTPPETVVLIFAIRHILGFQEKIADRRANISLTRFAACGLGQQAIRNALDSLNDYNILIKIDNPSEKGQLYELQEDEEKIDWDALNSRKNNKTKKAVRKTAKATKASLKSRGVTSDVRGNVARHEGITSDVGQGITSDVNIKTHSLNQPSNPLGGEGEPPSVFGIYEQEIGPLTPMISEKLEELEKEHTSSWVIAAMKIASMNSKRSLAYFKAILDRWKVEGYGSEFKRRSSNGRTSSNQEPAGYAGIREWLEEQGVLNE